MALNPYVPDVRFGSLADIRERIRDVRFTPKSAHAASPLKESALCQKFRYCNIAESTALLGTRVAHGVTSMVVGNSVSAIRAVPIDQRLGQYQLTLVPAACEGVG
jgi:hypothetical protein